MEIFRIIWNIEFFAFSFSSFLDFAIRLEKTFYNLNESFIFRVFFLALLYYINIINDWIIINDVSCFNRYFFNNCSGNFNRIRYSNDESRRLRCQKSTKTKSEIKK